MSYQLEDIETVTEPVTLAEVKSFSRIDSSYSADDAQLLMSITLARKRIEAYLNIGLAKREVTVYWNGHPLQLPLSPTGIVTELTKNGDILTGDDFEIDTYPAKTITIKDVGCGWFNNPFYSINGTVTFDLVNPEHNKDVYKCTYETGYNVLPNDLKFALLSETDVLYKLRGEPVVDLINPNTVKMVAHYSRNLIL